MSNAITTTNNGPFMGLMDPTTFDQMQRVGKMLALSPLFPDHLRKGSQEAAIANGVLVINMAMRLREDPLTVAQAIYFVGGKPGWSASYMISKANQHGVFSGPIDWEVKGAKDTLSVTAHAVLKSSGKAVRVTCDMAMARAEGWTKNAKYQTMPEQMLRYRSATFLIRLYCPEVMVGVPAAIEHEAPMRDVTPQEAADYSIGQRDAEVVDAVEETPSEPEPVKPSVKEKAAPKEEPKVHVDLRLLNVLEEIKGNLLDGAPPEAIATQYADDISDMKLREPDLFKELEDEIGGYAPDLIGKF